jgi:hypothetical protein
VVCILAQLVETDSGLALLNGGDCLLLSAIVDEFSGPKCKHLCGKPKLFFFLDEGNKQDNAAPYQIVVKSKAIFFLFNTSFFYLAFIGRLSVHQLACRRLRICRSRRWTRRWTD